MTLRGKLQEIIRDYRTVVKFVDQDARDTDDRAYGGFVRMAKGKLQEHITEQLVRATWAHIGGDADALDINAKKIAIPIRQSYIDRIDEPEVAEYVRQNIDNYVYRLAVDKSTIGLSSASNARRIPKTRCSNAFWSTLIC